MPYDFQEWEEELEPQTSSARIGGPPRKLTGIGVLESTGTSEEAARAFGRSASVLSEAIAGRVNLGRDGATRLLAVVREIESESSNT